MESVYTAYLSVIRQACRSSADAEAGIVIRPEEVHVLADLSQKHRTAPFLLPFLRGTSTVANHHRHRIMRLFLSAVQKTVGRINNDHNDHCRHNAKINPIPVHSVRPPSCSGIFPSSSWRQVSSVYGIYGIWIRTVIPSSGQDSI